MQEQFPDAYPSGITRAEVGRVVGILALGIRLLDDEAALAARIAEIRAEPRFNPNVFAVTLIIILF